MNELKSKYCGFWCRSGLRRQSQPFNGLRILVAQYKNRYPTLRHDTLANFNNLWHTYVLGQYLVAVQISARSANSLIN